MKIRLEEYVRDNGSNPYQTWFDQLEAQAAAKVTVAKARLELGNTSCTAAVEAFRKAGLSPPSRISVGIWFDAKREPSRR